MDLSTNNLDQTQAQNEINFQFVNEYKTIQTSKA